ncbi:MAG: hydrogenase maturation protease [Actinomycetota bacterium]
MTARVLVAGIGNIFLGDDGFGPEVARRLATQPLPAGVRVVDYGIRGMHLAYDLLDGFDMLVLVDAVPRRERPGDLVVLQIGQEDLGEGDFDAHGMAPAAVLAGLGALGGELPQQTYLVGCEPADVGERIGLSPAVEGAIDPAVGIVIDLVSRAYATIEVEEFLA